MPTVPGSPKPAGVPPGPAGPTPSLIDFAIAAGIMHERGAFLSKDTVDNDGWATHEGKLQRIETRVGGQMLDYHRSVDDIVKEGSDPKATSRFTSSSPRDKVEEYVEYNKPMKRKE